MGIYARLFASRHPDEVVGMVLVDAFEENIRRAYGPTMQRLDRQARRLTVPFAWLGIMRIMFGRNPTMLTGGVPWLHRFPAALHPAIFGLMYHPHMMRAGSQEWAVLGDVEEQVRSAGGLGDQPLAVLSSERFDQVGGPGLSAAEWAAIQQANEDGQARLIRLSTRCRQQIVEGSGHWIPLEQPEAVVAAIRQIALEIAAQNG
ncbi:MAG: alpha/beta hydrolase fold [Firmicutes bacterium]|nr:alpha/beta hydrolase fold [Bacillota bacterium]